MISSKFINNSRLAPSVHLARITGSAWLLAPFIVHFLLVGVSLSNPYLYHQDENYYMASTLHMQESGDYLIPVYNDVPRINKPIGFYWLIAPWQAILGHGFGSTRIVSWLASLGLLIVGFRAAMLAFGDRQRAIATVWVLASMDIVYRYSHYAVPEMTLTLFQSLACVCLWRWIETGRRSMLLCGYLAAAMAFNIKGPVGVILPFFAAAVHLWLNGRGRDVVKLLSLSGILALLALIAPWYLALMAELGVMRMLGMMGSETAGRVFTLQNSPLYYAPVLLLYFLPWSLFLLARLPSWLRAEYRTRAWPALKASFPFVWFVTFLAFYSTVVGEKHQWYALQWALPLAVLSVQAMMPMNEERRFPFVFGLIGAFGVLLIAAIGYGYWLLDGILCSGSAVAMLIIWISLCLFSLAVEQRRVTRIASLAIAFSVGHFLVFHSILPTTQLRPATDFAMGLQQQNEPFSLLVNERYFHKKLFLFDIPMMAELELERHDGVFEAKLREQQPDFALCRESVFDAMDLSMRNRYDPAAQGYFKRERERERIEEPRLMRILRFLRTGDESQILEPVFLLQRREEP